MRNRWDISMQVANVIQRLSSAAGAGRHEMCVCVGEESKKYILSS